MANNGKPLRFGFFRFELIFDKDNVKKRIKKYMKSSQRNDRVKAETLKKLTEDTQDVAAFIWNLLEDIGNNIVSSYHRISDKLIEFDKNTIIADQSSGYYFFQMVHDRDEALSKKKINQKRENVHLDDDEYISEFASVLYSRSENCGMIQNNRHSVSISQIGCFLSKCVVEKYQRNLTETQKISRFPLHIELRPILDTNMLLAIKNNKAIQKIEIMGSVSTVESLRKNNANLPIIAVGNALNSMKGYTFSLSLSAHRQKIDGQIEYNSIDKTACQDLYEAIESGCLSEEDRIKVKMHYLSQENMRETLTWSLPLKEVHIEFPRKSRANLSYRRIYEKMLDYFIANKEDIQRLT